MCRLAAGSAPALPGDNLKDLNITEIFLTLVKQEPVAQFLWGLYSSGWQI